MAALLLRRLHGLNTLHTFLQCIRTIHFGSVKCSWAWLGIGISTAAPSVLTQPVLSPLPIAGVKAAALPSQLHLLSSLSFPKDGLTGQQDPTLTFPSSLRSHSSRQAGAGSSPGALLYNISSAAAGERGAPCLLHPQQACEIVSSRAARSPCWSPSAPTHVVEEPLRPFPGSPCPSEGPLGTDKAGTMLAAQQPGSLLGEGKKSSKSSHGDQAGEMDWGRRGELPWESSAKPPALHRNKPAPFSP